ncbi:MOSC domain-containing protein [Dermatobacter hominis]|uniref:MOSC domain-containing protein n=1 Tax=Dermatobacter hominis TaxID=2884263 RepID=UPI001D111341|nr:MOSC domain-containing protein [Dermatobacter hominis]UDY34251.1 MOSC domain-containing protein [Dermatobacter hominis]
MTAPPPDPRPTTIAVLVGRPAEHTAPSGRLVRTAFRKHVVDGPVVVGETNLDGDEQADLRVHGGPDKAVLAYSAEHSARWAELEPALAEPGAFGENLHVAGLTEADVCIGDRWAVGSALFEVSQPRQPCWKVDDRWGRDDLVDRIESTGHAGWYLRVVQVGTVRAGDAWALVDRPHPRWTVAEAFDVMHHRRDDLAAARALDDLPELAPSWRRSLAKRVLRLSAGDLADEDQTDRRAGPVG